MYIMTIFLKIKISVHSLTSTFIPKGTIGLFINNAWTIWRRSGMNGPQNSSSHLCNDWGSNGNWAGGALLTQSKRMEFNRFSVILKEVRILTSDMIEDCSVIILPAATSCPCSIHLPFIGHLLCAMFWARSCRCRGRHSLCPHVLYRARQCANVPRT